MADGTYYAWSNFPIREDNTGNLVKTLKVGDPVSQDDLGVDDDEWDYLVETGVVRQERYPDINSSLSPTEHFKQQIAKAEGSTDVFAGEEVDQADEENA